jgi:hypothetical protein
VNSDLKGDKISEAAHLAGLSPEQIQQYLDQLTAARPAAPRKPRRKKQLPPLP